MLIDYRWLQSAKALERLEQVNFLGKNARMQWWYIDVVMTDGSVLLAAFVPKKWWQDTDDANLDDALVMVAILGGTDRRLRSVSKTVDASGIRNSGQGLCLEIPGLTIAREGGSHAIYRFTFDLPEVKGSLEAHAVAQPFSAFPAGKLSGLAQAALLGGRLGTEAFSYVSQVPRGKASGELTLGSERIVIDGYAYHEQGRFDDAPERLTKKGWFWCHFPHPEWNVFGSPRVFLYVQQHERPIFRGFNLFDRSLGFKNRTLTGEPPHHRVFSSGDMRFAYGGLDLSITADPRRNRPLISFPSARLDRSITRW